MAEMAEVGGDLFRRVCARDDRRDDRVREGELQRRRGQGTSCARHAASIFRIFSISGASRRIVDIWRPDRPGREDAGIVDDRRRQSVPGAPQQGKRSRAAPGPSACNGAPPGRNRGRTIEESGIMPSSLMPAPKPPDWPCAASAPSRARKPTPKSCVRWAATFGSGRWNQDPSRGSPGGRRGSGRAGCRLSSNDGSPHRSCSRGRWWNSARRTTAGRARIFPGPVGRLSPAPPSSTSRIRRAAWHEEVAKPMLDPPACCRTKVPYRSSAPPALPGGRAAWPRHRLRSSLTNSSPSGAPPKPNSGSIHARFAEAAFRLWVHDRRSSLPAVLDHDGQVVEPPRRARCRPG